MRHRRSTSPAREAPFLPAAAAGAHDPAGVPAILPADAAHLVVHLVARLDGPSLSRGLLDLIRHLPAERYRHAILCTGECAELPPACQAELRARKVEIVALRRQDSPDPLRYLRMFRALRTLRPDLIHTRDGAGLPAQLVATLAGVRLRVHGEHDDEAPEDGGSLGTQLLRRLLCPFIDHFIAASSGLEQWLIEGIGAEPARVSQIAHGVDSTEFHPRLGPAAAVGPVGFMQDGVFVIGSAGRMDDSAGHATLVEAFLRLIASPHPAHARLRLLIVGDGPARSNCQAMLNRAGASARAWLPGARPDLAQLLRSMDLFVLPAPSDDRNDAILQAMASGLPVVAAAAGVNTEPVHPGFTGILVPPRSAELLASAIADYCRIPEMAARHGARARSQVIARHSMPAMARDYLVVYDALLGGGRPRRGTP